MIKWETLREKEKMHITDIFSVLTILKSPHWELLKVRITDGKIKLTLSSLYHTTSSFTDPWVESF